MVCQDDFEFSFDKQTLGVDLKSRVRDMEDMKITAFHEAGHTLVAYYNKEAMPIHKVTIIGKSLFNREQHSRGSRNYFDDSDDSNKNWKNA